MDLTGKYYVDNETGEIFEVLDKVNSESVMVKEYDVKGAGQFIVRIDDLSTPDILFFDGVMDAQKYVSDNFEDSEEETANG
jgi:predicted RNA-binding protein